MIPISIQAIYHIRIENYAEGLRTPLSQLEISRLDYIVHCKKYIELSNIAIRQQQANIRQSIVRRSVKHTYITINKWLMNHMQINITII